ncbi:MAG: universal stress protein [Gaiellales bacterium]
MGATVETIESRSTDAPLPGVLACFDGVGIGVVLLHVIDRMLEPGTVHVLTVAGSELDRSDADTIAQYGSDFAVELGLHAQIAPERSASDPADAIMDTATRGIDLIAVGSSSLPLSLPHLVHSTAKSVIRRASIPVLVVPYGHEPFPVGDAQSSMLLVVSSPDDERWLAHATAMVALPAVMLMTIGWEPSGEARDQLCRAAASSGHVPAESIEVLAAADPADVAQYVSDHVVGDRQIGLVAVVNDAEDDGHPDGSTLVERIAATVTVPVLAMPLPEPVVRA